MSALRGAAGVIAELWYALAVKRFASGFSWPVVAWFYIVCAGLVAWRGVGLASPGCALIPTRMGLDGGRRLGGPSCAACKGVPGWAPPTMDPMGGEIGGQIGGPPGGGGMEGGLWTQWWIHRRAMGC